MTFTTTFTLCFSTSRRLERSERSHGLGGSSTRTSSGSLRTSSSTSKMKEKKKEEEEEEIGTESPRSEEKLKDEEVSEVREVEESVEKLLTNGDADGEEPRTAETADESEEVRQEVRHPHYIITMVTANLLSLKHRPLTSEAKGSAPAGVMWSDFDPWSSPALMSSDGPG